MNHTSLQNLILSASAGTGKTFTLTTHIIRLLAQKDVAGNFTVHPKDILALTFSKAAAFEIYTKLVTRLAQAAASEQAAAKTNQTLNQFSDTFIKSTGKATLDYTLTAEDYASILRRVISSQHINSIATIDSFILRMVQYMPLELGLLGGVSMIDDYDKERLLEEAVETALNDKEIRKEILDHNDIGNVRTPAKQLKQLMNDIQKDIRYNPHLQQRDRLTNADLAKLLEVPVEDLDETNPPRALATLIGANEASFEHAEDPQTIGLLCIALFILNWTPGTSFKHLPKHPKNKQNHAIKIRDCYLKNPVAGQTYTYKKKEFTLPFETEQALLKDLKHLSALEIAHRIRTQLHTFKVVQQIDATYDQQVRQRGKLSFEDLPWFFYNGNIDLHRIENIEYHFDERFAHWAVDEFQDTSHAQWACLKSFIENAADKTRQGDNNSVTIVGDVKQAIYAWRGGDERILLSLLNDPLKRYDKFPLQTSYRYQKHTCDFLNRLFGKANMTQCQTNFINKPLPPAIKSSLSTTPLVDGWLSPASWMEHFPANGASNDYVKIIRYKKDQENDIPNRFKYLGDELSASWKARGKSNETFGVIVNKNDDVNQLAEYLRSQGLPALSESESAIIDLPTIAPLLALLKLIEHPDDTLAWETVKRTPILHIIFPEITDHKTLIGTIANQYATYGLARLTSMWVKALLQETTTPLDSISKQRLIAIATAAETFERTSHATDGIVDFITYLQMQKQRTIVTDPNTIRVITIHRSKGLGFDHVFLPIEKKQTGLTSLAGFNASPSYAVTNEIPWTAKLSKEHVVFFPKLARIYEQTIDAQILSNLHSYYVAMTRSKQSLTILYEDPTSSSKTQESTPRFESILEAIIGEIPPVTIDENACIVYEAGTPPPPLPRAPKPASRSEFPTTIPDFSTLQLPTKHASEQPSKITETYLMSDFFADTHGVAAKRGTEMHQQLETIAWIDPNRPVSELEKTLLDSPLCEAFIQPQGEVTLLREYSYDRFVKNIWQTGQFDRVIITGTGKNRHAVIYDYKTNHNTQHLPLAAFAQQMATKYHHQMTSYREALSNLFQIPLEAIETKLLLLETKQIVSVQ